MKLCIYRFNNLLSFESPQDLDCLLEEFVDFQLLRHANIPPAVWEQALVVHACPGSVAHHRVDVIWHYMSTMKAPDHSLRFIRHSQVAKLVMVIPHSNAQEERIFSIIRKNKTHLDLI